MRARTAGWLALGLGAGLLMGCSEDSGGEGEGGDDACQPGEICATVTAAETTGQELRLILYEADEADWPQTYRGLPTPSWVVKTYPAVPESFPLRIRIPLQDNLFAITSTPLEGARLGLAIATGVASTFVVEPTDARGFSAGTLVYEEGAAMDYGEIALAIPEGDTCDANPFHPECLTGPLFWEERMLGAEGFVPGAIYMDTHDIDGDGVLDLVTVGEPHFEKPELPLDVLKLGIYYLAKDPAEGLTVRETEVVDQWSEADPLFYSPWGVRVIEHAGEPMIVVGTNIPGLAPLEEGTGAVLSYRKVGGAWERGMVRANPDPTHVNYNAMIVVPCDIDDDGDTDIALSGAFGTSALGSWAENTGDPDTPWIEHLTPMAPDTDPHVRGTLGYKCHDLNGDGYPEIVHNAMFDVADSDPPRYRGEIWLAVNPGPAGWDDAWQRVVIDDDNWASADMWFHDFDGDGHDDLVANQIFGSTVTLYHHPGDDVTATWAPEIIISGLTSPSDFWLTDMDGDDLVDVVSADHTAHRGVWHKNPGASGGDWRIQTIFRDVRLPGDFEMVDLDEDGDLDWLGTSLTTGQAFLVEQVHPPSALVVRASLPDGFDTTITKMVVSLSEDYPATGFPAAFPVNMENTDLDGDGELDVDALIAPGHDMVVPIADVGVTGDYHVVVALYVEGGGEFMPVPGTDYMAGSEKRTFGAGPVEVDLELGLAP